MDPMTRSFSQKTTIIQREDQLLRFSIDPSNQCLPHLSSSYEVLLALLHVHLPDKAQWWSRGRAFTNEPISPSAWGCMKVFGKRLYEADQQQLEDLWNRTPDEQKLCLPSVQLIPDKLTPPPSMFPKRLSDPTQALRLLDRWVHSHNQMLNRSDQGEKSVSGRRWAGTRRVVGALALDEQGNILGYALNQPQVNPTFHAEWCLLDHLWREERWPQHGKVTLLSSLKPCKRCAGLWATYSPRPLQVIFIRDDPGSSGRCTAFDADSYAFNEASRWRSDWGSTTQVGPSQIGY